jgi:hypothetical protein
MRFINAVLFLFLVAQPVYSSALERPQKDYFVELLSPQEVKVHEKLEIGIRISPQLNDAFLRAIHPKHQYDEGVKVNPFLSDEFLIEAIFTHESGKTIKRQGFYYRDMARDIKNNRWIDNTNTHPLRIRFTPELAGKWEVEVHAFIENPRHDFNNFSSSNIEFHVAKQQKNAGFVQVNSSKTQFIRNEQIITPIGINLPHPIMGNNMLYSWNPNETLNLEAWKLFNDDVLRFAQKGGKYFRFFMGPSASDIEFEELGNYFNRLNYAWEIDNMLAICEEYDVLVVFNMLLHTPVMVSGDYQQFRWDFGLFWPDPNAWPHRDPNPPYCYQKAFNFKLPSEMFLHEESMRYIKERYRYMLARWGYSTSIMMFEPLSEPWHIDENSYARYTPYDLEEGDQARKAAHIFHRDMLRYIKKDLGHTQHLFGVVGRLPGKPGEIFSHPDDIQMAYADSSWFEELADVLSISNYSPSPDKMLISKRGRDNNTCEDRENSFRCAIDQLQATYNKPVFFAEADHGDDTHACSSLHGLKLDAMRFPITGAAGHFVWAAFNYSHGDFEYPIDERDGWRNIVLAERYFNTGLAQNVLQHAHTFGREKASVRGISRDIKEHSYVLSSDRSQGIGYIYNRTFNVHTMGDATGGETDENSRCFIPQTELQTTVEVTWKPQRMKIEGLKPRQRYTLRYFDYTTGRFVHAFDIRSNMFGNSALIHPVLDALPDSSPFYWYQIEETPR